MNFNVHLTDTFQKSLKALKKKYPGIKEDLAGCIEALENDPSVGDAIPGWNRVLWKVRVASSDVKKGKRGGYRVIYFWSPETTNVFLLVVYFKGEKVEISKKEITALLKNLEEELGYAYLNEPL